MRAEGGGRENLEPLQPDNEGNGADEDKDNDSHD
jgi:hypothetical protein